MLLAPYKEPKLKEAAHLRRGLGEISRNGRLKVAPEHTSPTVLRWMRKPSFDLFGEFKQFFDRVNREAGLKQQLVPYFISSHPGCTEADMAELRPYQAVGLPSGTGAGFHPNTDDPGHRDLLYRL